MRIALLTLLLSCAALLPSADWGTWDWQRAPFDPSDFVSRQECIDSFERHYQPFEDTYKAEVARINAEIDRLLGISAPLSLTLDAAREKLNLAKAAWDDKAPAIQKALRELEKEERELNRQLKGLYTMKDKIEKLLTGATSPERRAELIANLDRIQKDIEAVNEALAKNRAKRGPLEDALAQMKKDIEQWQDLVTETKKQLDVVKEQLRVIVGKRNEMDKRHEQMVTTWRRQAAACRDRE